MRFFLLAGLLIFNSALYAQSTFRIGPGVLIGEASQLHELILVDYSKLLGTCIDIDDRTVYFKLRDAADVTELPKSDVRFLGLYDAPTRTAKNRAREGRQPKPVRSGWQRPAFADGTYHRTALPTRGKGQYRNLNVLYNIAEFKLNDHVQLGAGLFVPFGILTTQRLRLSLGREVSMGLSNQALFVTITDSESTLVGDLNANFTLGDENRFLNFGGGFFYNTFDDLRPTHLNLALGGRISDNWHIYGELSIVDDEFDVVVLPAFSAAHTVRRHRWRYGFFNILSPFDGPLLPLPFVGYEYHW